jgi:galactose mutarotase-like enzyme
MTSLYRFVENPSADIVEGAGLTLAVRRLGAEVVGLTWRRPNRPDVGLLWRNGEFADPPRLWKNHATILFPTVGRIVNLHSRTTDGVDVRFHRLHGFARDFDFALLGRAGDASHYVLRYLLIFSAETLALYPWRFELWVKYELFPDRLVQTMTVFNRDDRPMPFQLGWHPGFRAPLIDGEKARGHLRLPAGPAVQWVNDDQCLRTGETWPLDLRGDFHFTEENLDRTYMLDFSATPPDARVAEWFDADGRCGVRLRFPDYPHLGLWSEAGAPYICIEPWQGMDDAVVQEPFDKKLGIVILPPGEMRDFKASIEVVGE